MDNKLKNKIVLITGAAGGIGSVIATQFADAGAKVIVHYHSQKEKAIQLLGTLNGDAHMAVQANLTNADDVETLVNKSIDKFGKIDVLVNNAGIYFEHSLDEINFSDWQNVWNDILGLNLIAPANLTHRIANKMIKQGGGKIINISSRGAFRGEPTAPAYAASKAGLNAMSQSLAKSLAPHDIYVYAIAPGFVETAMARPHLTGEKKQEILNQSPLGRVAKPEEIANTALFLASEGTDFLTGCIIDVNGASYLR